MENHWDKNLVIQLLGLGLSREQAMQVVGIVAEERQKADREGFVRGYNNGFERGYDNGFDHGYSTYEEDKND